MDAQTAEAVRHEEKLQNIVNQQRILLEAGQSNEHAIYRYIADILYEEFDQDFSKVLYFIRVKLDWPLSYKHFLLYYIRTDESNKKDRLNNLANFVIDPTSNLKRTYHFPRLFPKFSSIERQYGSAVSSIFHIQYGFFILNILTLIICLSFIIIPYEVLASSRSSSNESFSISTLFTSKNYLSESIFFQGSYPFGLLNNSYNLSLIYFLTILIYFLLWFIYLTRNFSLTYKEKVLNSIINTKIGNGFLSTFGRFNYTIQSNKEYEKYKKIFQRQFLDLIGNDETNKFIHSNKYQTWTYKFKLFITNLLFVLLLILINGINWIILSSCDQKPTVDCYGSIIYLTLINRLMPYTIVILTHIERYKYLSYKLDIVGFRCLLLNISTILLFVIYFFIHANEFSCYETAFGQFLYILLLADLFASLIFPFLFGFLFDLIVAKKIRDFDGINIHVEISPPVLLYSQFLLWIGIYFSPLLPIMVLLNILFSFLSHRFYIYIRSFGRSDSSKRVFIWNSYRLKYLFYLFSYIIFILSATCFVVFTTQIKPSETCGPFRQLNGSYEVISNYLLDANTSVLWVSIVNFLTSSGFIYFLGVTFFIVTYKIRHEGLAEKQLVFIRENNLENKKHLRQNVIKKLHVNDKKVRSNVASNHFDENIQTQAF